ncbi:hypothetical protein INR49_014461 [Caranx melampygus]|nr:hypothetical protein INR49_014461 [Caranx melampygus]
MVKDPAGFPQTETCEIMFLESGQFFPSTLAYDDLPDQMLFDCLNEVHVLCCTDASPQQETLRRRRVGEGVGVGAVQRREGGHAPESVVQEVPDVRI